MARARCCSTASWGRGFFSPKFLPPSSCRPIRRRWPVVVPAAVASTPARPERSPRRTSSTRAAAFPISRSSCKGSIPLEFRPLIGDRIFGCDDCLDACPWNRFAQVSRESAFAARPLIAQMRLRDFLALSDEQFRGLVSRFTDQANQASWLPAQCLRRARQCRNARRFTGPRRRDAATAKRLSPSTQPGQSQGFEARFEEHAPQSA